MTKKKRFGIVPSLSKGLTDTIQIVENNNGLYRNVVIPLDRIETDPDNPRKMLLTVDDIRQGYCDWSKDPQAKMKKAEWEKLHELAQSIKISGLINPIIVYKYSENYRIVAGERRYLAALLGGRTEIEARAFQEKPNYFALKLVQWFENTEREDLSVHDRLGNVKDLLTAYAEQHPGAQLNATLLGEIAGLSLPQASCYITILQGPQDVLAAIEQGSIASLDKAMLIASCKDTDMRAQAIGQCIEGISLKQLRSFIAMKKTQLKPKVGRPKLQSTLMNLGETPHISVIRTLIESVLGTPPYQHLQPHFMAINWEDKVSVKMAFRSLIKMIETKVIGTGL